MGHIVTDVLIIGSGVAGSRAAIEAARHGSVTMICKQSFNQSATHHAQGGIAGSIDANDSEQSHYNDTMKVGCKLNDENVVKRLVKDGPQRIQELIQWGFDVDLVNDKPELGREGGHSVNRIVHAHGDQTGRELVRTLKQLVEQNPSIRVFDYCFLLDFIVIDGTCLGAVVFNKQHGHQLLWAKQTILASGGCGQIWRETTNPPVSTGDGMAAAFRAGAKLCDMEFMQFHPTTLYVAGSGRALISEAVRGEGAHLVDEDSHRFMKDYHDDMELAPRDIVSRAIHQHIYENRLKCVFLDVRHIKGFETRFPHITQLCAEFNIDVTKNLIPVRPSSHYMIGGVAVDIEGRTSIEGLYSCGESACTGVHGANRLASNSLLEGLVFGAIVGENAGQNENHNSLGARVQRIANVNPVSPRTELDLPDIKNSLRSVMWRNVGIVRSKDRLAEMCDILEFWGHYTLDKTFDSVFGWEVQNQLTLARLIALSALARNDSVGVHYRSDATNNETNSATKNEVPTPYHLSITRNESGSKPIIK